MVAHLGHTLSGSLKGHRLQHNVKMAKCYWPICSFTGLIAPQVMDQRKYDFQMWIRKRKNKRQPFLFPWFITFSSSFSQDIWALILHSYIFFIHSVYYMFAWWRMSENIPHLDVHLCGHNLEGIYLD